MEYVCIFFTAYTFSFTCYLIYKTGIRRIFEIKEGSKTSISQKEIYLVWRRIDVVSTLFWYLTYINNILMKQFYGKMLWTINETNLWKKWLKEFILNAECVECWTQRNFLYFYCDQQRVFSFYIAANKIWMYALNVC